MKRITTILTMLMLVCMGAWADGTITIASTADTAWPNGKYYNGTDAFTPGTSGKWGAVWISTADGTNPQVKVANTTDIAYLNVQNGRIATTTFNIVIQPGYKISGFTLEFAARNSTAATVTSNGSSKTSSGSSNYQTLTVSGLSGMSTSFSVSGDYIIVKTFTVSYVDAPNAYYALRNAHSDFTSYQYFCQSDEATENFNKVATDGHLTDLKYVWQAPHSGGYMKLKNAGTGEYAPKFTSTSSSTAFTMTDDADQAETFSVVSTTNARSYQILPGQFTLNSRTQTTSFLDGVSSAGQLVACHNAQAHKGAVTVFKELKKVSFVDASSQATTVAVNGGSAVSTIYVATDGSDSFTLPGEYLYSIGGATEVNNTTAASTIAAAGTTDLTVTVNEEIHDAAATITSGKLYRIFTKNNGSEEGDTKYYMTPTGTLTSDMASAGTFTFIATTNTNYVDAGYAWKISNGNYRFTNRPTYSPGQSHINTTDKNNRDDYEAQVFFLKNGKYAVRSTNCTSSGSQYVQNSYWTVVEDITSDGVPDATYDDTEGVRHYIWQIEEVASVTYNLIFQGETIKSVAKERASVIGTAALPESSWDNACCAYSYSPSTIDSETNTVNITMTWNIGSLTFSKDYASATWYHMSVNDKWAKYDASVNGTTNGHPLCASLDDVNYDVAGYQGMWAFVGNPIDGVFLMNREAGDGQVLGWTTPPRMQSTNEGSSKRFVVSKLDEDNFILYYSGYYISDKDNGSKLVFWNNESAASDAKSGIAVEPISLYEQSLIELDNCAATHAEGKYFGLKSSAVTGLRTQIKTAKASFNAAAYSVVHDEIEALWPGTANANVYYPATGYYRIKSSGNRAAGETYITYGYCSDKSKYGLVTTPVANKYTDAGTIIKLASTATTGVYTMSLQGLNVQDVNADNQPFTATASDGVTFAFEILSPGVVGIRHNTSYAKAYLHESGWASPSGVVRWEAASVQSQWTVEDAATLSDGAYALTINMNDGGDGYKYATTYLPFDATINGVNAYTLDQSGEWLVPAQLYGNEVPAGTPVLLKGTAATANVAINTGAAFSTSNVNDLLGVYVPTDFDLDIEATGEQSSDVACTSEYFLGVFNNKVGFYHSGVASKTVSSTKYYTLGANKAYLPVGGESRGFAINWDDEVTGIRSIDNGKQAQNNGVYYDLSGRRVENPQHGMYIVNGRVVVIK